MNAAFPIYERRRGLLPGATGSPVLIGMGVLGVLAGAVLPLKKLRGPLSRPVIV